MSVADMYESLETETNQAIPDDELHELTEKLLGKLKPHASNKEMAAFISGVREGYAFARWKFGGTNADPCA